MTWERLKCLFGFHDWEWKRTPLRNFGGECGWSDGYVCKKCNKKKTS